MRAQVINNCQGPHYIQGQSISKPGEKPVAGPLLILRPGLNLVETKDLAERRKANPSFDGLFKAKVKPSKVETADPRKFGRPMLEVVGKAVSDQTPFRNDKGEDLSLEECEGIIALIEDTDTLSALLKSEKSGEPRARAISARLKEIASGLSA